SDLFLVSRTRSRPDGDHLEPTVQDAGLDGTCGAIPSKKPATAGFLPSVPWGGPRAACDWLRGHISGPPPQYTGLSFDTGALHDSYCFLSFARSFGCRGRRPGA